MKRTLFLALSFWFVGFMLPAETLRPVQWKSTYRDSTEHLLIVGITAEMEKGWHIYGMNLPQGGPVATEISFPTLKNLKQKSEILSQLPPLRSYDSIFDMEITTYENQATFRVLFEKTSQGNFQIEGEIRYMACNGENCLSPQKETFSLPYEKRDTSSAKMGQPLYNHETHPLEEGDALDFENSQILEKQSIKTYSFITLFLLGGVGGLLALITPCLWPMIPLTLGFFLKRNKRRRDALREVLLYGLSIVCVYMGLGLLFSMLFGASFLNQLATNMGVNLFLFALLVVFGLSFLGVWEWNLPASWVNFFDKKAEKGSGILSIFFMALTLSLVSFSCTAPIIGTLLVEWVSSQEVLAPMVGMLGFSLALAIPFALIALSPNLLKRLPKSGEGLKDVKFVLGIGELAFSLKFFSVADCAYHWGVLSRGLFLYLWMALSFLLMTYFLWGTYKSASRGKWVGSLIKFCFSLLFFLCTSYLYRGTLGMSLGEIESFLPPKQTNEKNVYHDFEEGIKEASLQKKRILLNFSGYGCVNCRKMEALVLNEPEIKNIIEKDFILITLYVDDRGELPSPIDVQENNRSMTLKTWGEKWSHLQATRFKANAQPYYLILSPAGIPLRTPYQGKISVNEFKKWLSEN